MSKTSVLALTDELKICLCWILSSKELSCQRNLLRIQEPFFLQLFLTRAFAWGWVIDHLRHRQFLHFHLHWWRWQAHWICRLFLCLQIVTYLFFLSLLRIDSKDPLGRILWALIWSIICRMGFSPQVNLMRSRYRLWRLHRLNWRRGRMWLKA